MAITGVADCAWVMCSRHELASSRQRAKNSLIGYPLYLITVDSAKMRRLVYCDIFTHVVSEEYLLVWFCSLEEQQVSHHSRWCVCQVYLRQYRITIVTRFILIASGKDTSLECHAGLTHSGVIFQSG